MQGAQDNPKVYLPEIADIFRLNRSIYCYSSTGPKPSVEPICLYLAIVNTPWPAALIGRKYFRAIAESPHEFSRSWR